jgi:hypothetical protein
LFTKKGEVVFQLELTCFHTNPKQAYLILRRVAGWPAGWVAGWPVGNCDYVANSAQLKLELGLSLATLILVKKLRQNQNMY